MTQSTILSSGAINGADTLTIEVIQPDSMPAVVRIVWPTAATITTAAHYREVGRREPTSGAKLSSCVRQLISATYRE